MNDRRKVFLARDASETFVALKMLPTGHFLKQDLKAFEDPIKTVLEGMPYIISSADNPGQIYCAVSLAETAAAIELQGHLIANPEKAITLNIGMKYRIHKAYVNLHASLNYSHLVSPTFFYVH